MDLIEPESQLLALLMIKIGVMAAIGSILIRSGPFQRLLFRESRNTSQALRLGLFLGLPAALGILVRVLAGYKAADVGLEMALLAGLLGGHLTGAVAGLMAALPGLVVGEWLGFPILVATGVIGGEARRLSPLVEDIWHFSPFVDMNIYRWYQRRFGKPRGDWQMLFFLLIVVLEAWRLLLGKSFPGRIVFLNTHSKLMMVAIVLAGVACIAVPIKIWNNTRNELKLEEQHALLVESRMMALSSQINPHFLFNTLNSIFSLVRTDPELARVLIQKLSNILRRLLQRHDTFAQLREEMAFVDDYLSIERVRFGEKLAVVKDLDESTMDTLVPSMLLQPIVENSIKHGLSNKVEGGTIQIRSARADGRVRIEILDDGVGIPAEKMSSLYEEGIGLGNAHERMRILYGSDFTFRVQSDPGSGTRVEIEVPEAIRVA